MGLGVNGVDVLIGKKIILFGGGKKKINGVSNWKVVFIIRNYRES